MKRVLAFDFGASSGRAILGGFENGTITLNEVHRFSNDPVELNGVFYWDVLRLFHEIGHTESKGRRRVRQHRHRHLGRRLRSA